ncbi:unnamed protein product [Acanthocheilonema viteae]|uniref:Uncharacterized protein n=1 Tax=Acanthocheilonema viteae TaxID=6277 RepID=A0A498S119_ACAVI|nr:unnamed protein product [Acanthocheilonema viteae]
MTPLLSLMPITRSSLRPPAAINPTLTCKLHYQMPYFFTEWHMASMQQTGRDWTEFPVKQDSIYGPPRPYDGVDV